MTESERELWSNTSWTKTMKVERPRRTSAEWGLFSLILLFFLGMAAFCVYHAAYSDNRTFVFSFGFLACIWVKAVANTVKVMIDHD